MAGIHDLAADEVAHVPDCPRAAGYGRQCQASADRGLSPIALVVCTLALLAGAGGLCAGQSGVVKGTVAGPSHAPIPGARVTLVAADGGRQSVVADEGGHYAFPAVDPGVYTLSAEAAGFESAARQGIVVKAGGTTGVDLQLAAELPAGPVVSPSASMPSYYDDTPFKASAIKTTIDAAGYSSQAESPQRLLREGPSLGGAAPNILARTPGSPEALRTEASLKQALQDHPGSFEANHQLGEFYLSVNDWTAGIPYLETAQHFQPEDERNAYELATAFLEAKNPGRAQGLLQDVLRRQDNPGLRNVLGAVDEALGDSASALKEYERAAQMDPSERNLFDWGNELLLHGSLEPAMDVFKRGAGLYPQSSRMYVGLGIASYSRNLYDGAIEALCHASDLNPTDPRPYLFLGRMYNVSSRRSGMLAERMKRFTETNPDNAQAYFYYALICWKGARGEAPPVNEAEVEQLFRKSISLDPHLADAHLQLGILLEDQHRDPEALAEFKTAISIRPDDADAHYRLAQAYLRAGRREEGQAELETYEKLHK